MNDNEIINLLKHGRSDEIQSVFRDMIREDYPGDFSQFIDEMISEYHVKRKDIAVRSGMSQDYTYKLLRGDKKTNERDYILAICIAIGMNLAQIQHALKIYGMPILDSSDLRSHVIMLAVNNRCDIDTLDDWLDKARFPLLKTSPEMPSAQIIIHNQSPLLSTPATTIPIRSEAIHNYEEIDRIIEAERCGHAPLDYAYEGTLQLKDEEGNCVRVLASFYPDFDKFMVLTEEMYQKFKKQDDALFRDVDDYEIEDIERYLEENGKEEKLPLPFEGVDIMEEYDSLEETVNSHFFRWFLELDKATDDKVREMMGQTQDTRNYGVRCGAKWDKALTYYLEAFNTEEPEKREYFQIIQVKGKGEDKYTFSISHESYYLQIEMGDIYPAYYGEVSREPEYFISVSNLDELDGVNLHYRFIFRELLQYLHRFIHDNFNANIEDQDLEIEDIDLLAQRATAYLHANQIDDAIQSLEEAYERLQKHPNLAYQICTCIKLADFYRREGKVEQSNKWYQECLQYKDDLKEIISSSEQQAEGLGDAPLAIAEALCHEYEQNQENVEYIREAIEISEGHCNDPNSWAELANYYHIYAFHMDEEEPERSLEYTEKAMNIIRDHALDRIPSYHYLAFMVLNNHAWVLWNRLSSEEAIIYYGKAIDLIEGYLATGTPDVEKMQAALEKEGKALYQIYIDTNKKQEAKRLINRMIKKGIDVTAS